MIHNSTKKDNFFKSELAKWLLPVLTIVILSILSFFPTVIEKYYSTGVFLFISKILRRLTGFFSFSIGDVVYALFFIGLLFRVIKFIVHLFIKDKRKTLFKVALNGLRSLFWLYIVFQIFWGLNYYRLGIAYQLNLAKEDYTKVDVENITCDLVKKLNTIRPLISKDSLPQPAFESVMQEGILLYDSLQGKYTYTNYINASLKKSMYSSISHYIGFTGYYNPFIGEAQLSTNIPKVVAPFVVCHEIAHQLGYAEEDEANFVGYLVATKSNNLYFQYSAYLELYKYAAVELLMMGENNTHAWELDSLVKKDLRDIQKFFAEKSNNIAPVFSVLYSNYLKANRQSKGLESYNDVVGLLISLKKKQGKI